MTKDFKTIDELMELLRKRGVSVDGQTAEIIRRESYYAVINGYKQPFLDTGAMESSSDDVYREGTFFKNIYDLFLFDRDLRFITFKYLTRAEAIIKTSVVYAFCNKNRERDAYLERSNYCRPDDMLVPKSFSGNKHREHRVNLNRLMGLFNDKLNIDSQSRPFITHYVNKYGGVPLWVLSNDLTFGNIAHFFQLQKRGVQNETCKIINDIRGNGNGTRDLRELLRAINVLVGFRNICAHDERLYCAVVKDARFNDMITMLSRVIPQDEVKDFISEINSLLKRYASRLDIDAIDDLITGMGVK